MLNVTRSTDYAARIVLHLASQEDADSLASIAGIAAMRDLPVPFVRRIVSRLAEAGILRTARGVGGGVALSRPAEQITLYDVVRAMEGPTCPSPCPSEDKGCPFVGTCPVRGVWDGAGQILDNHFRSVSFSDLANAPGHRQAHRKPRGKRGISRETSPTPERNPSWTH